MTSDFESSTAWDNTIIRNSVRDGSEAITDSVTSLRNRVIVGSFDQDSAGEGVLHTLNKSVFIFTEWLLVNDTGPAEIILTQVVQRVEESTTASERNSLTVSLLGTTDTHDTSAGEDFERGWINTFLVNNYEVFAGAFRTEFLFECNDLVDFIVGEGALRRNEFLSLVGVGPEEARVDFCLLVLKRHVKTHDVAVLHTRGQVWVSTTVIEN